MKKLVLFTFLWSLSSLAAEVDHFMALNTSILDSAELFNEKVNNQIQKGLKKIPADEASCLEAQKVVFKEMQDGIGFKVNKYYRKEIASEFKFPHGMSKFELVKSSIYKDVLFMRVVPVIEEILNFNGIYFGIDKLSHFFAMGRIFFNRYLRYKKRGLAEQEIEKKLLKSGDFSEKTYLGLWGTLTYSYADQESNYQGFLFFKNFCYGEQPYLVQGNQGWKLSREVDIRDYVNPYWNEIFNPSAYAKIGAKAISKNIQAYCEDLKFSPFFHRRMNYYKSRVWKKSNSQIYFEELMNRGESPSNSPFSIESLCPTYRHH